MPDHADSMAHVHSTLRAIALAVLLATPGLSPAQPWPEPPPQEIIDGEFVFKLCDKSQYLNEEGLACARNAAARAPKLDPAKREFFGAFCDPKKYVECLEHGGGREVRFWSNSCDFLLLQGRPAPECWPYPEAKRPNLPLPDLDKYYREGISPKEYYGALCGYEAGEFIYRTVENVEGIYQIRRRPWATDRALTDPFVLKDPYGYLDSEGRGEAEAVFLSSKRYRALYAPSVAYRGQWARAWAGYTASRSTSEPGKPYIRIARGPDHSIEVFHHEVASLDTAYGYLWRENTGVRERPPGIAGGELIVVELRSGEVLGYLRGFARSPLTTRTLGGVNWRRAGACPLIQSERGRYGKDFDTSYWFLKKVLRPANTASAGKID